jgi:hypothetical protein
MNRPLGGQFDLITRHEGLVRRARAGDTINPIAAMLAPVRVERVQNDIPFTRLPQGVRLNAPCRALIVEFHAKAVRGRNGP